MIKITNKKKQKDFILTNWESLIKRHKLSDALKRYFEVKEQIKIDYTDPVFWNK